MEVEPLNQTQLEDLGLNTCSHDLSISFREVPKVDEPKPQSLSNFPSLDVNLGDKRETDPLINTYSSGSFRVKSLNVVNEVVYHSLMDFTLVVVVRVFDLQVIFDEEKLRSS
ncbi:hypothetical protein Tco_0853652 [Tanacetum coccineum]